MRHFTFSLLILCAAANQAIAGSPSHEKLVDEIEAIYFPAAVFTADSPVIKQLLDSAAKANPGVDDVTWQSVRAETATVITRLLTAKGSIVETQFRSSVESFSDDELKVIRRIFGDPTYRKYQAAMASNAAQKNALTNSTKLGLQLTSEINAILISHQLNEVH
jgi:hypothetical protein